MTCATADDRFSFRLVDDDAQLVERSRSGDLQAFERLVERHSDVVYRVAARTVGAAEAEDVSQDAFLRAFHRLPHYRGEGSFRAWLLQIVHNTGLNALARRRPEPVEEVPEPEVAGTAAGEREPAERLERDERRRRLEMKLRALRPEHRVVLVLRDIEGLPYDEIAAVTEMPLGSVKGRLHRARAELIDVLRNNTYDWELPK